jgi:hypothetical protein
LKARNSLGDLDVDGRTILKIILRKKSEGVDWIQLGLMTCCENIAMNIRVLSDAEEYPG